MRLDTRFFISGVHHSTQSIVHLTQFSNRCPLHTCISKRVEGNVLLYLPTIAQTSDVMQYKLLLALNKHRSGLKKPVLLGLKTEEACSFRTED